MTEKEISRCNEIILICCIPQISESPPDTMCVHYMIDRQTRNFPWKLPSLFDDGKWNEFAHLSVELRRSNWIHMSGNDRDYDNDAEGERERGREEGERRIIWIQYACIICRTA